MFCDLTKKPPVYKIASPEHFRPQLAVAVLSRHITWGEERVEEFGLHPNTFASFCRVKASPHWGLVTKKTSVPRKKTQGELASDFFHQSGVDLGIDRELKQTRAATAA